MKLKVFLISFLLLLFSTNILGQPLMQAGGGVADLTLPPPARFAYTAGNATVMSKINLDTLTTDATLTLGAAFANTESAYLDKLRGRLFLGNNFGAFGYVSKINLSGFTHAGFFSQPNYIVPWVIVHLDTGLVYAFVYYGFLASYMVKQINPVTMAELASLTYTIVGDNYVPTGKGVAISEGFLYFTAMWGGGGGFGPAAVGRIRLSDFTKQAIVNIVDASMNATNARGNNLVDGTDIYFTYNRTDVNRISLVRIRNNIFHSSVLSDLNEINAANSCINVSTKKIYIPLSLVVGNDRLVRFDVSGVMARETHLEFVNPLDQGMFWSAFDTFRNRIYVAQSTGGGNDGILIVDASTMTLITKVLAQFPHTVDID